MRAVVTLEFEPTVAGIREGRTALDRLESLLSGGESTTTPTPVAPGAPDVVAVYERCEPELRSRELLELLPGDEPGLTPPTSWRRARRERRSQRTAFGRSCGTSRAPKAAC
jgi:hypothetical protein